MRFKFNKPNNLIALLASIIAVAALMLPLAARAQNAPQERIDRIVAFGTSLTDTGNGFIFLSQPGNQHCGTRLNVPPYDALEELLVPSGPYARGGHHFTNGAVWVEGLARSLGLAGNVRPALQNTGQKASNYATGGARALGNEFSDTQCQFNLPAQVTAYLMDFPQTTPRTVIAIEIGSNDVRDALVAAASRHDPRPIIANALGSLSQNIIQLYGHGAQRFLLVNVPDIGKTPAVRALGDVAVGVASNLSQAWNAGLANAVTSLTAAGINIKVLDVFTTVDDVVDHPENYGFQNATDACLTPLQPPFVCAQPDTYVFWDGIHPTKAMHAVVAQEAMAVVSAP
jgi:phospholipase/lecithinase/hemolysin